MVIITPTIQLNDSELQFSFIRSPGPGGQNVNKVASAVLLRFNVVESSSLPPDVRTRLLALFHAKLTAAGEILIKATRFRTQERNKLDAIERLRHMIQKAVTPPKKRRKTKPTYTSTLRRLSSKKLRGKTKSFRGKKSVGHD